MNQYDRFDEVQEERREAEVEEETADKATEPEVTLGDDAPLAADVAMDVTAPDAPGSEDELALPDRPDSTSPAGDEEAAAPAEPAILPEEPHAPSTPSEPDSADAGTLEIGTTPREGQSGAEAVADVPAEDVPDAQALRIDSAPAEESAPTETSTDVPAEDDLQAHALRIDSAPAEEPAPTETSIDTPAEDASATQTLQMDGAGTPLDEQAVAETSIDTPAEDASDTQTLQIDGTGTPPDEQAAAGVSSDTAAEDTTPNTEHEVALSDGEQDGEQDAEAGATAQPQPSQQGQEPSSGRDEADAAHPRVVISAGTDEQSLEALRLCREKVNQLHIKMHPLAARYDGEKHVVIFFRADDKVDFRKLVRELSRILRARIEMRQLGPREQGKLCGLIGKCGYPLCCQTFLGQFAQSSIKMAKAQDLALNPLKISGVCGRLMCCLNFEQEHYAEVRSRMPKVNRQVETEFGPGRVASLNVLRETVTVQFETTFREIPLEEVRLSETQG